MKLFAFLMALLVLGLSLMPCADGSAMPDNHSKMEVTSNHQDKDNHIDECSPFCHCSCCASYSIHYYSSLITKAPSLGKDKESDYLPAGIIEIALPIWQPPQLQA